jgi:phosphatidate cytidylyltransferase
MLDRLKDLKGRVTIHSLLILLVSALIYFSVFTLSKILILLVVIGFTYIAHFEFSHFAALKGVRYNLRASLPFIILWPSFVLFWIMGYPVVGSMIVLSYFTILLFTILSFDKIQDSLHTVSFQVFAHLYITLPISLILGVLFIDALGVANDGRFWLAYLICVVKGADVGGYFFGSLFGKRPLAPMISPKKTVEGLFGALGVSIVVSLAFYGVGKYCPPGLFSIGFVEALILGVFFSGISVLGDLVESLFKRDAKLKNSSSIPAVGGVLDIIDSLIFAAPFLFGYLLLFR